MASHRFATPEQFITWAETQTPVCKAAIRMTCEGLMDKGLLSECAAHIAYYMAIGSGQGHDVEAFHTSKKLTVN